MKRQEPKLYLVEREAMPEVLLRVLEAKELLETKQSKTVAEAAQAAGLSRSVIGAAVGVDRQDVGHGPVQRRINVDLVAELDHAT